MEGTLLRRYGGFYYVESEGRVWTCRLRGRFRLQETVFLPGDRVEIKPVGPGEGVIEDLKPRRTCLKRPAVANVEQVIIVFALREPPGSGTPGPVVIFERGRGYRGGYCLEQSGYQ